MEPEDSAEFPGSKKSSKVLRPGYTWANSLFHWTHQRLRQYIKARMIEPDEPSEGTTLTVSARCLGSFLLAVAVGGLTWQHPGGAQESSRATPAAGVPGLRYPVLARCSPMSPPLLPQRWRAVALMTPFENEQLDVGEFIYDASLPAMRATVTGLESGAIDLLITDDDTYRLSGSRQLPTACTSLGRVFRPPTRQWLTAQAQCVGRAPLAATPLEWWSMPSENSTSSWYWYRSDTRLPWRTMRIVPASNPAIIGEFALTNFTAFERLPHTDLAALRDFCRAQAVQSDIGAATPVNSVRALMKIGDDQASEAERDKTISRLIPGLEYQACASTKPFQWPPRFEMTAIMLSTEFGHGPYPAEIYYDWSGAKTQLTRLHNPGNPSDEATLDGLLKAGVGYHIVRGKGDAVQCEQAYPGVIRPDWMIHDGCQCRGTIRNNPRFGRNQAVQILSCPVNPSGAFWAWYSSTGRPITFQSTAPNSGGLTLADYDRWTPMTDIPAGTLTVPVECKETASSFRLFPNWTDQAFKFEVCSGCHLNGDQK
jgi:hypothetical protein